MIRRLVKRRAGGCAWLNSRAPSSRERVNPAGMSSKCSTGANQGLGGWGNAVGIGGNAIPKAHGPSRQANGSGAPTPSRSLPWLTVVPTSTGLGRSGEPGFPPPPTKAGARIARPWRGRYGRCGFLRGRFGPRDRSRYPRGFCNLRKFARIIRPLSVRMLSGWNWTPQIGKCRCRKPMTSSSSVHAVTTNSGGSVSRWATSE